MSDPGRSLESPRERTVLGLLMRWRHLNTAQLEEVVFDRSEVLASSYRDGFSRLYRAPLRRSSTARPLDAMHDAFEEGHRNTFSQRGNRT